MLILTPISWSLRPGHVEDTWAPLLAWQNVGENASNGQIHL